MTERLVPGDPVSCSRVGGAMRRHAGRLLDRCDQLRRLAAAQPDSATTARLLGDLDRVAAAAGDLDSAGALLQRYATDLAEAKEHGRQVERQVEAAGLTLVGGRVTEPWGPASSETAARRQQAVPALQAGAERARFLSGTARSVLARAVAVQVPALAGRSGELRGIPDPSARPTGPARADR